MPGIFLKHGDAYVAMQEQHYDAESVLQELIEHHPVMLAGDDKAYGRLVLVKREAGVNDREDGGARWSLDHLYLDAAGVPTLVEVKRSSDTRGRREVVAQMLDYAANAKTSFNTEQLEAWLTEDAARRGRTVEETLREELGVEDVDEFWEIVRTNLAAERFRLIFVSDRISSELRTIIEFLNGQMTRTEVLAIEVKQYVDESGQHQTIVPRLIGNTQAADAVKRPQRTRGPLDRQGAVALVREAGVDPADAAAALLEWADHHAQLEVTYGGKAAADIRCARRFLLRVWPEGELEVTLRSLSDLDRAWSAERIDELVRRIETIDGVRFLSAKRNWPRIPLAPLADASKREQFTAICDEVLATLNAPV